MSIPHLHSVKCCPEKSRLIKYGDWMHGIMIPIEYIYKLGRKKLIYGANEAGYCTVIYIYGNYIL